MGCRYPCMYNFRLYFPPWFFSETLFCTLLADVNLVRWNVMAAFIMALIKMVLKQPPFLTLLVFHRIRDAWGGLVRIRPHYFRPVNANATWATYIEGKQTKKCFTLINVSRKMVYLWQDKHRDTLISDHITQTTCQGGLGRIWPHRFCCFTDNTS